MVGPAAGVRQEVSREIGQSKRGDAGSGADVGHCTVKGSDTSVQLAEQGLLLVQLVGVSVEQPSVARNTCRLAPSVVRASMTLAMASSCCAKLAVSPENRADSVASVVFKIGFRMALLARAPLMIVCAAWVRFTS